MNITMEKNTQMKLKFLTLKRRKKYYGKTQTGMSYFPLSMMKYGNTIKGQYPVFGPLKRLILVGTEHTGLEN